MIPPVDPAWNRLGRRLARPPRQTPAEVERRIAGGFGYRRPLAIHSPRRTDEWAWYSRWGLLTGQDIESVSFVLRGFYQPCAIAPLVFQPNALLGMLPKRGAA